MTILTIIVTAHPGWSLFLGFWLAYGVVETIGNTIKAFANKPCSCNKKEEE